MIQESAADLQLRSVTFRFLRFIKRHVKNFGQRLNGSEDSVRLLSVSAEGLSLRLDQALGLVQDLTRETSDLDLKINRTWAQVQHNFTVQSSELFSLKNVSQVLQTQLQNWTEALLLSLSDVRDKVKQLQTNSSGLQKVAFSVGLSDSGAVGPFDSETVLKFSQILTNHGSAYDPQTGLFSAPVPGLFFFSFCVADFVKGYMGVSLYHNDRPISFSLSLNAHGGYDSVCNSALLRLEAGDTVSLRLPASYRLHDDQRRFSLFSGFSL
ncbi:hypothetical protein WMY93_033370 [Mugilogobius chulae]|uniref:C1q domain-containing protein n=1 Tax=Mugilogobius chulae TaxID=88201 RepID=A0AAW0MIW6_9GOBI